MPQSTETLAAKMIEAVISELRTGCRLLPDVLVDEIYSYHMCEDGRTLQVMANLTDGTEVILAFAPGHRITCLQTYP